MNKYQIKCDHCGKFISTPADSYTDWGNSTDVAPPDESLLCEKCVNEEIEYYTETKTMPCRWRPANYEQELANKLGYIWQVEKGCAWGLWKRRTGSEVGCTPQQTPI